MDLIKVEVYNQKTNIRAPGDQLQNADSVELYECRTSHWRDSLHVSAGSEFPSPENSEPLPFVEQVLGPTLGIGQCRTMWINPQVMVDRRENIFIRYGTR